MDRRYIFIGDELENLKDSILGDKKFLFKRVYDQCKLYKEQRLTEEHPNGSSTFMAMGALNLSMAYLLTEQKQYLDEAKRWIFTGVGYPHWGHAHLVDVDLSASWLLFGYSLSYNWLKDDFSEKERKNLKDKLILQAERMYDFAVRTVGEGWSTNFWQNHNWINFAGLAAAGYALKDEHPAAAEWIEYSKNNFETVYEMMPEDGSDYEGVVYWRYGVPWLYIYAHMLKEREGIDLFKTCDFLKNTFFYRLYQSTPDLEETMNFGDCHDRRSSHTPAVYFKVAAEYDNGYAQKLGKLVVDKFLFREQYESGIKPGILPEAWLELLWYSPEVKERNFQELPLVKYWKDLGLVVIKNSWEADGINFSFKCGAPGGTKQWEKSWEFDRNKGWKTRGLSHQHPDNNSFIIYGNGGYLAIDDGYNRTVKACEHNTVVVDGKGYTAENQNNIWKETAYEDIAELKTFLNEGSFTYMAGESSKCYDKSLKLENFTRHVINSCDRYFYIFDELKSEESHTYSWLMHSDVEAEKKDGKLQLENGPAAMDIYTFGIEEKKTEHYNTYVKAIMTTQEPDKYRETNMKTIKISNSVNSNSMKFLNVLDVKKAMIDQNLEIDSEETNDYSKLTIKREWGIESFYLKKNEELNLEKIKTDAKIFVIKEYCDRQEMLAVECSYLSKGSDILYKGSARSFTRRVDK